MLRIRFAILAFLLVSAPSFGQSTLSSTDSQTLQDLLAEVRQLRPISDAQEQLRLEQAKLSGLEDQLDQLEKSLENLNRGPQ